VRISFALAAALSLSACRPSGKVEAASLDDAVDRYRRAEGVQKVSESEAVAGLPCTSPEVCDAKKACLGAMNATTRALGLKDEVARTVGDLQEKRLPLDASAVQDLPGKLDEATQLLQEGRTKMADCEKQLVDLRLRFGQ
jgi:hypothetical protein